MLQCLKKTCISLLNRSTYLTEFRNVSLLQSEVMDISGYYLAPKLTFVDGRLQTGVKLKCSADGQIDWIGTEIPEGAKFMNLPNQAIFPGMINTHSHAFHIALRYMNEAGGDFWKWRQNMYKVVEEMTSEKFYEICLMTFKEMLQSGITTVGEFHYFHHSFAQNLENDCDEGQRKKRKVATKGQDPVCFDLDEVILKAAQDAGIRIVLLETFYERGGFRDEPVNESQKHFVSALKEFTDQLKHLKDITSRSNLQHLGVAAHSMRAVGLKNLKSLHSLAKKHGLPFHLHLEEQPKEISDCLEVSGSEPSTLLLKELEVSDELTVVHATHTSPKNMEAFAKSGTNFSICPLTEGCLGDGIINWPDQKDVFCSLGTDCNKRICMAEEMRWLAYLQQVKNNKRGLPNVESFPDGLFEMVTKNGARSLGLQNCGELKVGNFCDFFTIDLSKPIFGNTTADPLNTFIFAASSKEVVSSVCVAGKMTEFWKPKISTEDLTKETKTFHLTARNVEDLLVELMNIDSTSGMEQSVQLALSNWLSSRNWNVQNQYFGPENRGNLLATRKGASIDNIELVLNTHYDTVPPYIPPTVKDGVIRGRGSNDAKGVLAAMVFGAEKFLAKHKKFSKNIALLFVSGEEVDHCGAKESQKLGLKPKYVICGEPTKSVRVNFQKGILKVDLKFVGKAGHSGFPHVGKSATEALIDVLSEVKNYQWPTSEEFGDTTVNFGLIKGGVAANVIPPSAEATLCFRIITSPEDVFQKLKSIVGDRAEMQITSSAKPIRMDLYDKAEPVPFNTDLGYLNLPENTKKCLVGPGDISNAHGPDEFIRIEELKNALDMYCETMERFLL